MAAAAPPEEEDQDMSISRWDPWGELVSLREAMNNLFEESFVRPRPGGVASAAVGLALDVRETPDAFTISASVPGVPAEDVEITVLGDTVRIRGERKEEREEQGQGGRWLLRERRLGAFERSVSLPATVKADAASAEFKDGVLTITLPKAEEAKPRAIPVRAGGASSGNAQEVEVNR
jgi:HSP20 family protein